MSVIAKLYVSNFAVFGTGSYAELSCVSENALMAAYATEDEDKLFTKYSPWGEIRLHQRAGWAVFNDSKGVHIEPPGQSRQTFYAMMVTDDEAADQTFPGAAAFIRLNCYSKTKFAGDGSRVELREVHDWGKGVSEAIPVGSVRGDRRAVIERLSWKMQVDNPPAEAGFVPGQDYWLVFYDASGMTMRQAIAAAHGHTLTPSAA